MKRLLIVVIFILIFCMKFFGIESVTLKNTDKYSGNFVYMDQNITVFIVQAQRIEFQTQEIAGMNFEESEDEFELTLDDDTVLTGAIVDSDEEFFTFGTTTGFITIEKNKIKEIRNPKYKNYYKPKKDYKFEFHIGNAPYFTYVLNNINTSYQAYWSYELYFESTFYTRVFFGIDVSFMMLLPLFGNYNDFLFFIPINFYVKYQDNFYRHKNPEHPIRNLFWHIKIGFGFAPSIFAEISEQRTRAGMSFSAGIDYGIKYYVRKFLAVGLDGKTNLIAQRNSYLVTQSIGVILEFKF